MTNQANVGNVNSGEQTDFALVGITSPEFQYFVHRCLRKFIRIIKRF